MEASIQTLRRWKRISCALRSVERAVAAASRLDAYRPVHPKHPDFNEEAYVNETRALNTRLNRLECRMERELDRLTAELLTAQFTRQKTKGASV
jgi:hypothetical protein